MMDRCVAGLANVTPFRGVSADVGSVYEMGFMRGLGRPVFGYTHDPRPYRDRVAAECRYQLRRRPCGVQEDADGMAVEDFQLHDNLMLAGGLVVCGCDPVSISEPYAERFTALTAFERCVANAAAKLTGA